MFRMKPHLSSSALAVYLLAGSLTAQIPSLDQSTLSGRFNFIYGVYQRGNASVSTGTLTFDGKGHYDSVAGTSSSPGSYRVNPDGRAVLRTLSIPRCHR